MLLLNGQFPGKAIVYHQYQDWVLLVVLLGLMYVVFEYYVKPLFFSRLVSSVFNQSVTNKIISENNSLTNRITHSLNFVFYLNASLAVFLLVQYFDYHLPSDQYIVQALIVFFLVAIGFNFRLLIYHFIGWVTNHLEIQLEYTSHWMILNKLFGLLLIPGVLLMLYLPDDYQIYLIITYLVIYSFLFMLKIFRGLQISFQNRLSLFSIILYLCALEIMPVGMLIKFLMS